MTDEERLFNHGALLRGYFINKVSFIEKMIELYIANHFCKDGEKSMELIDFMLGDRFISFESKRTAFERILKKHRPKYYKEIKTNFELLTIIQTHRNRFAHLILYNGPDAIDRYLKDGSIAFVKFNENTQAIWYDPKLQLEVTDAVDKIYNWFNIDFEK